MHTQFSLVGSAVVVLAAVPMSVGAAGSPLIPIESFRDANIIVTVNDPPDWVSDSRQETWEESGPFEFDIDLSVSLPTGIAEGRGTQMSQIDGSGIQAQATLSTAAEAELGAESGTIAWNEFRSTFSLTESSEFLLQGSLSASGEARCAFALLGGPVEHAFTVTSDTVPLDLSGTLPIGVYVLYAKLEGNLVAETDGDPSVEATGSFDFEFSLGPATPIEETSWSELKHLHR